MSLKPAVRLGIIGLGNMGSNHAKSVLGNAVPGLELTAVADKNLDRLKEFENVACYNDSDELISSGKVDAIIIATPHYSHTPIGIAVLQAGLHLLVEKPISVHKEDCEKLIAAYRPDSGQVFAAMFNQRTDARYRKLKQMLDEGALGPIRRINWIITDWFRTEFYYKSGDWRATWGGEGGGVLLNQCPHNLDLWQWLFGMPEKVTAHCQIGRFHDIEVEDSVTAVLEYESGTQGVFVTTTGEAPGTNRLEVVGENGKIIIEGDSSDLIFTRNERPSSSFSKEANQGFSRPNVWNVTIPVSLSSEQQHTSIMKNFTAAIRGDAKLIAPASEGIRSVELANAMLLSSFRNCSIILPLDAADYASELKKKIGESRFIKTTNEASASPSDFSSSF